MYATYIFWSRLTVMLRVPNPKSAGAEVGVSETMISRLVHGFYEKVRQDEILAPVFEAHVQNWGEHLDKMCAFWSSVTLLTGSYKGRPMDVHAQLPEISDELFERWLQLFRRAAREHCPPAAAHLFTDRAERIAESLKLGIAIRRHVSVTAS
jgi:hemoglobin